MVDGRGLVLVMRARRPPRQRDQARRTRSARRGGRRRARGDRRADRPARLHRAGRRGASPVLLDEGVADRSATSSAPTARDMHLRGVEPGRDFAFERADVRAVEAGDLVGGHPITIEPAIEVGNIFQLGTRYSKALGASYLDEQGAEQLDLDGLLRDRHGAHRRRRRRAVRRRARDLLAGVDRAVRGAPGRRSGARAAPSASSPRRPTRRCATAASTSSTTTATRAPARSSPTPSCWARRCG